MFRSLTRRRTTTAQRKQELTENRPHVLEKLKTKQLTSAEDLIVHIEDHFDEVGTSPHGTLDTLHRKHKEVRLQANDSKAVATWKNAVNMLTAPKPDDSRHQRRESRKEELAARSANTQPSPTDLLLQSRATAALCLALGGCQGSAAKGLALEALVDALEAFGTDLDVAKAAAKSLGDLGEDCDPELQRRAAQEGAFQELLDAVRAHPSNSALRFSVNRALARLTGDENLQVKEDGRTTPLRERMAEKFYDANQEEIGFLWP